MLLLWVAAIAVVDLLPVPTSVNLEFSLSFPLQLAVALIYPPPVAAAVTFLGTSDMREIRRELPLAKALFIRAQMAASVIGESALFHALAQLDSPWYRIGPTVLLATVVGYSINTLLVAWYFHLESREPLLDPPRDAHRGLRRVRVQLHGARPVQRAGRDLVRRVRPGDDRGVHRAARVRASDVLPDALVAGRDRRAGRARA
jgi:hypothetical protein